MLNGVVITMGFCVECGETTSQVICFECFSKFDLLEADEDLTDYKVYILKTEEE